MQLGFVIDHSRCIGCHACTVACKAENDVPLGVFRTWVKYIEEGSFPDVRRSFAVLRCNQCTDAPCVTICPVGALEKRPDGIVDVDPRACIGCKACLQGCPYDALYINDATGTAEKCHFCAHRIESGLAPACAVVCPTAAIIPGDFHDPASAVSRLRAEHLLVARKPEAGTGPNVLYRELLPAAADPTAAPAAAAYMWAERPPELARGAEELAQLYGDAQRRARTVYAADHPPAWRGLVSGYLFTKSLASGMFLASGLHFAEPGNTGGYAPAGLALGFGALAGLCLTAALLVADLGRPSRFWFILRRPNWDSWLARGSFALLGYGALLAFWLGSAIFGSTRRTTWNGMLWTATAAAAVLAAAYTGWLFAQARGRVLWMRRGLWAHLVVQAWLAGSAAGALWLGLSGKGAHGTRWRVALALGLILHALFVATEKRFAPRRREREYARAHALLWRGPFGRRRVLGSLVFGIALPLLLLLLPWPEGTLALAAAAALSGLWIEEDTLVRAGQALPLS